MPLMVLYKLGTIIDKLDRNSEPLDIFKKFCMPGLQ